MKVFPYQILRSKDENIFVKIDRGDIFYDKLHQHEEIQIAQIVKGEGQLLMSETVSSYRPGDIFVIGGNSPHLFQSLERQEDSSHMISVFFTKKSFGDNFFNISQLQQIGNFFEKSKAGFKLKRRTPTVDKIMQRMPEVDEFSQFLLFLKLLKILSSSESELLTDYVYGQNISTNDSNRLKVIIDYVMDNFHNDITLEKIADLACITPNAFCHFFKQRTDKTFFQFLIEIRIEHACHLIIKDHDLTMADISARSGFKSISNFNRKFKELKGMTPSQYYRKKNRTMVGSY